MYDALPACGMRERAPLPQVEHQVFMTIDKILLRAFPLLGASDPLLVNPLLEPMRCTSAKACDGLLSVPELVISINIMQG